MPQISWVLYRERVVARDSPAYLDVTNRPVRQLVELHGWDPDDASFSGLHHFPLGIYTDDIREQTANAGITIHNNVTLNANLTMLGSFAITATADLLIHLATHKLIFDGGNIQLGTGAGFSNLEITDLVSSSFPFTYGTTALDPIGSPRNESLVVNNTGYVRQLKLGMDRLGPGGDESLNWRMHYLHDKPYLSMAIMDLPGDTVLNKEEMINWLHPNVTSWRLEWFDISGPINRSNQILKFQYLDYATGLPVSGTPGVGIWDLSDDIRFHGKVRLVDGAGGLVGDHLGTLTMLIDSSPETGWSLGTGGTQKGGLAAGTDTLATTQLVVNALVALVFSKHHLTAP